MEDSQVETEGLDRTDPALHKRALRRFRSAMDSLSLPSKSSEFSNFDRADLLVLAARFSAPSATYALLDELSEAKLRWYVKRNFILIRDAAVAACLGDDVLPLNAMQAFVSWKVSTSDVRPDRPVDRTLVGGGSDTTSDLASSPEIQQLLATVRQLTAEVQVLKDERSMAPDDDEDRTAGGRRLLLLPEVIELLPKDPVREELTKQALASILREYPLPRDYILKAGELSVDEKAKLPSLVAEEITKLGKIINRFSDVARPLLALLNTIQGDLNEGASLVSATMVRSTILDALRLLFHQQTRLETERHLVHFRDERVLQAAFQKAPKKAFFSGEEKARLQAIAEEHKRTRKMKECLKPSNKIKKAPRPQHARPTSDKPQGPARQQAPSAPRKQLRRDPTPSGARPQKGKPNARGNDASAHEK